MLPAAGDTTQWTANGLARRTPRVLETGQVVARRPSPDGALLAALTRHLGHGTDAGGGQSSRAIELAPPADHGPVARRPDATDAPTDRLPRRVRGAQLPTARVAPIRRTSAPPGPGCAPAAPAAPPADPRRSPDDVYRFLTSFAAGVQRGLDESGQRQPPRL